MEVIGSVKGSYIQLRQIQSRKAVIAAIEKHNKTKIMKSIKSRFHQTGTYEIKLRMLDIAREVLKNHASEWIREL